MPQPILKTREITDIKPFLTRTHTLDKQSRRGDHTRAVRRNDSKAAILQQKKRYERWSVSSAGCPLCFAPKNKKWAPAMWVKFWLRGRYSMFVTAKARNILSALSYWLMQVFLQKQANVGSCASRMVNTERFRFEIREAPGVFWQIFLWDQPKDQAGPSTMGPRLLLKIVWCAASVTESNDKCVAMVPALVKLSPICRHWANV